MFALKNRKCSPVPAKDRKPLVLLISNKEENMVNQEIMQMLEKQKIAQVISDWAFYRDQRDFDRLQTCFHPDARIKVSFFSGSADKFIQRIKKSKKMNLQHLTGNIRVVVKGDRAIAESQTTLLMRVNIFDIEADITCYLRFIDFVEKRDMTWRILYRVAIYEKDTICTVNPSDRLDLKNLAFYPPSSRHLCFYMDYAKGISGTSSFSVTEANTKAEKDIYEKGKEWLAGGEINEL